MRALLALAVSLALAACATVLPERSGTRDPGGSIAFRAAEIAAHSGARRFHDGFYCASACTMWLGYERTCVEPGAIFGFHAIRNDVTGIAEEIYEAHLRDAHPDLLRWFYGSPDNSREMTSVTGEWLMGQGWARPCD